MAIEHHFWVSPALTLIAAGLFGLLIGSFLNVVVHRLPLMMQARWDAEMAEMAALAEAPPDTIPPAAKPAAGAPAPAASAAPAPTEAFNLMVPGSRCPHCGHKITALENIPVLSWLWLRGRCSGCRAPISARYPIVEAVAGGLAVAAIAQLGLTLAGVAAAGLCLTLLTLALIDFDTQLLPDDITLPLLWAGLLVNLLGGFVPLPDAVVGAMLGYLVLWVLYWAFRLLTGKEGMGYGDFKLLAALGAWFGWQALPAIILLASLVGAVVGIAMMVFKRLGRDQPIPFGPYLAGAGILSLFFSGPLMRLYGFA